MIDAILDALDVLSPLTCAGCGALGAALCDDCAAPFFAPISRVDATAREAPVPVWSAASYTGPVRAAVVAWKKGREDLDVHFEEASRALADRWACEAGGAPVVVPAPSGWRRRVTGRFVVGRMAAWVADALGGTSVDVLRRGRGPAHLAGLDARERARSRADLRMVGELPPGEVLLVDDVLTTGATLAACVAALRREGRSVRAALVLAATPRSSTTRGAIGGQTVR